MAPGLISLSFGDERTVLVRLRGSDGRERFLSMLRLDGLDAMAHDGWQILREVVGGAPTTATAASPPTAARVLSFGESALS